MDAQLAQAFAGVYDRGVQHLDLEGNLSCKSGVDKARRVVD